MKKVKIYFALIIFTFSLIVVLSEDTRSEGVSIDAGLTPAYHRLMVRSQLRYMHRSNHPVMSDMDMKMYMMPTMLAYGLRSDLMIMLRQAYVSMDMNGTKNSGLGDLFLLMKYKLFRVNKPGYTLGLAPTIGIEFPTGADNFTSDSYDMQLGLLFSARKKYLSADINLSYMNNGLKKVNDSQFEAGDEISVQTAVSYKIKSNNSSQLLFAPLLEMTYTDIASNKSGGTTLTNSGESFFILAPGLKVTYGSFILEGVFQVPLWQDQDGNQTERDPGFIIGFRLMN